MSLLLNIFLIEKRLKLLHLNKNLQWICQVQVSNSYQVELNNYQIKFNKYQKELLLCKNHQNLETKNLLLKKKLFLEEFHSSLKINLLYPNIHLSLSNKERKMLNNIRGIMHQILISHFFNHITILQKRLK